MTHTTYIDMISLILSPIFIYSADCKKNVFLYVSGVTRIGTEDAPIPQDITIQGPGIEAEHCLIINEGLCWFTFSEMTS